ncbi:MAG TPA: glycosyltransferase family A protein [Nitrososphaeraceae archaeon]|nr:glycosyltransferase family A protein [Nitrososphaeraceae archaeon]
MTGKNKNDVSNHGVCTDTGLVSIVIPTKDSGRTLQRCLDSIMTQTYQHFEILIVDKRSTDDTISIAGQFKVRIFSLDVERTTAKNFATRKANGTYVLFLDSDMLLEPTVIEQCVNAIQAADVGGIVIPEKSAGLGFWIKVRDFERSFYYGTKIESARFFRTNQVIEVGGFDEMVIMYEESTLPQRIEKIGLKTAVRVSSFIIHDEGNFKLKSWLRKKRYYSQTARIYAQRYKSYSQQQLDLGRRTGIYIRNKNWITLMRHPILTTGLVILKSLEFLVSKMK